MTENNQLTERQRSIVLVKKELTQFSPKQIDTVLSLLQEGNTVPFIARYRKDQTNSLNEVHIRQIEERQQYLENLVKRKDEVIRKILEQDKLTDQLEQEIQKATTLTRLEDLYRPYKQKRRTKATIAKEKGLEPLANWLLTTPHHADIMEKAAEFINEEKDVKSLEDALDGVHEIIAEMISDNANYRTKLRNYTRQYGRIVSTVKNSNDDQTNIYEMYYEYEEPVKSIVPHRVLALNRAEKEEIIRVGIVIDVSGVLETIKAEVIKERTSPAAPYIEKAIEDSYKRFIGPAIEREIRNELSEKAEQQAIHIFGENLKNLLLQAPMKEQIILGLDPAYRTGCKLAVIDETGKVLGKTVIYPHKGGKPHQRQQAAALFQEFVKKYGVTMIAIGNGTASRESEQFVAKQIKEMNVPIVYTIVSEAGASVYSASEVARLEFPDYQVEERSAVSIARRLQDPLAELVKIDPKAVGVGQYQHDVSQKELDHQLDFVVETAVNQVGVDVNTASAILLAHIAGLTKTTANNIVTYRDENGKFTKRQELKKVPRLGPKAYEQAIGFLRILDGDNILDSTEIHPESYQEAKAILEKASVGLREVGTQKAQEALQQLDRASVVEELAIGKETYELLLQGLTKPGRDPRDEVAGPILRNDVLTMDDLQVGMELEGTVRNVVDFGAFVDIGVKQDGLVHISRLTKSFVKHPSDIVAVGDIVKVWVVDIDTAKNRIALTMIQPEEK
ncbi:uncharacterized protein SAMN05421767_10374 [Granulicatella balaenopterae]|uniref:S1 motif domain-containing protein n=1 Tax=Granulicatella balaenopterae TaxID=137733 RepID=A0A1H9HVA6_9LACT|nr:Tex family protein [Granulicatella balaenopterae]SEQ66185.1 uncharacterized protein SAMN05421767_10374 [Granulicatella balaenopterae]